MKHAVIEIGGNQYLVAEGDELLVDRLDIEEGKNFKIDNVLLTADEGKVEIGTPLVESVDVVGKILSHEKGEKIRVSRFRAKSRYRKTKGFRAALTRIKIEKIGTQKKASGKAVPKKSRGKSS